MYNAFYKYPVITKEASIELDNQYRNNEGPFAKDPIEETGYFWIDAYLYLHWGDVHIYSIDNNQYVMTDEYGGYATETGTLKELNITCHAEVLEYFLNNADVITDEERKEYIDILDKLAEQYIEFNDYTRFIDDLEDENFITLDKFY